MGNRASSQKPPPCNLLMLGMSSAGKTSILERIKPHGKIEHTIPTIGFMVESRRFRGTIITSWDSGGRGSELDWINTTRARRYKYFDNIDGVIFVVDSSATKDGDYGSLEQARDSLHHVVLEQKELRGKPLLIFCNKQDLPDAMPPSVIAKGLALPRNRKWNVVGCSTYKRGMGIYEGLDWMSKTIYGAKGDNTELEQWKQDDMTTNLSVQSDESAIEHLEYNPTEAGGNLTLKNFSAIKNGTECPFAKSAILWGGPHSPNWWSLELQAEKNVAALTEFVRQSQNGANLDGFCIELVDTKATNGGPEELGECVRRMLLALSDHDPSGEQVMRKKHIGLRGWRFRFNKADFFITTFAPCYPPTSSRYAFGTGRAFLLLQPQASFGRHNLPMDTPDTNWDTPKTVRDKTRVAFRDAGRGYHIPRTTRYPAAEHIVRPLNDDGETVVRWWEPSEEN